MGVIILPLFMEPLTSPHQDTKEKYLGHFLLELTDVPSVFSTALQHVLIIIYKWQKGLGSTQSSVQAPQCLALHFLRPSLLQWIHTGLLPPKAADSKAQERSWDRCIAGNFTQLQAYFTSAKFSWCTSSNLLLCAISGKSWKVRKMFPNHVEVRNLEWARWKKSSSDLLWTVGQIRVCKR